MTKMEYRYYSLVQIIKNLREPKVIRRCLGEDNKRLLKQVIFGIRIGY